MEQDSKTNLSLSTKNPDIISFFEKNEDFIFVYKKTEKLATAIYMITNLFSDNEPMKWSLRKKVSDLLSFTLGYKDILQPEQFDFVYNIKTKILELVSMIEICSRSGLISQMNFSLLKQEFFNLVAKTDNSSLISKEFGRESISKGFFDMKENDKIEFPISPKTYNISTIKDNDSIADNHVFKRSNRQNIILNLLKKKKELTIKDISEVIKDCSEKTIQRELISFISAGILRKTGERRWSKYSLVG